MDFDTVGVKHLYLWKNCEDYIQDMELNMQWD